MSNRLLYLLLLILAPWTSAATWCEAQPVAPAPHATFRTGAEVTSLTFTASGANLIAGGADGRVHVWSLASNESVHASRLDDGAAFVGALGDTAFVAISRDGRAVVRTLDGQDVEVRPAGGTVDDAALDAVGRHLALLHEDGLIEIRRVEDGAHLGTLDASDRLSGPVFVGFDALGQQLAAISERGEAVFWNPVTQRVLRQTTLSGGDMHGSRSKVHVIASRPEANLLVAGIEEVALPAGGLSGRSRPGDLARRDVVVAFDWERAMEIGRMEIPDGQVTALAVGPGPDHVAVARQRNKDVQILDLRAGQLVATVAAEEVPTTVATSDDDRWLAIGLPSGDIAVWALTSPGGTPEARGDQRLPALSGRIRVIGEDSPAMTTASRATVAVLPFESRGTTQDRGPLVTEILTAELANLEYLTLVERLRIEALLDELALQEQGITRSDGLEIGRMLQADYVILGSLDASESSYLLNARLLDVETAEVVSGRQVACEQCRTADLVDAVRTLGAILAQRDE